MSWDGSNREEFVGDGLLQKKNRFYLIATLRIQDASIRSNRSLIEASRECRARVPFLGFPFSFARACCEHPEQSAAFMYKCLRLRSHWLPPIKVVLPIVLFDF
jgi:hypothetical protein